MADGGPVIRVCKWGDFQHYKERTPPWIKLHRALLDKKEWHKLSGDACKLLAECWLVASEHPDGLIELSTDDLTWRLRRTDVSETARLLQELAALEFLDLSKHDSASLIAQCTHDASAPLDRGEAEGETEAEDASSNELGAGAPFNEEHDGPDLYGLDANDGGEWATIRTELFAPLRKHIWQGKSPPQNVPNPKWNEGNELSIVRNWLRAGTMKPDEVAAFFRKARTHFRWLGPASLSWINTADQKPQVLEVVNAVRKDAPIKAGLTVEIGGRRAS